MGILSRYAIPAATAAAICLAGGPAGVSAQDEITAEERRIVESKCTPCHSAARILLADPATIRTVIADMREKNPAFFTSAEVETLNAALVKMLSDPEVAAGRQAWVDLVEKGRALFSDASLGTAGKSCATCHEPERLRGVAADFPKFDGQLNRYVSLLDKVNTMISRNMGGKELPLGDERSTALEAYLRSLR